MYRHSGVNKYLLNCSSTGLGERKATSSLEILDLVKDSLSALQAHKGLRVNLRVNQVLEGLSLQKEQQYCSWARPEQ